MYVCMYVCMYIRMYVYTYVYIIGRDPTTFSIFVLFVRVEVASLV